MDTIAFLCFLLLAIDQARAYKNGAPSSSCLSRFPEHGGAQPKQADLSPYRIVTDKSIYNPGDEITVRILSAGGHHGKFRGILLVAHLATPGTEENVVGTFKMLEPEDKLKYVSCEGRPQSGVTHDNATDVPVSSVIIKWVAPAQNMGPIVFEATMVESYSVFHVNLKSPVLKPEFNTSNHQPAVQTSAIRINTTSIDWDKCGQDKGCLLYPRYCRTDCLVAASFQFLDEDTVRFEMTTKTGTYISVGFSDDKTMGGEQTITCTDYFGLSSVQTGYNQPDKRNTRQLALNLTDLEVKVEDGRLSCRFTRPVAMESKKLIKGKPGSIVKTDLKQKEFYLFLAWGDTYLSTDTIRYHKEYPVISNTKVSLTDVDIFRGSCMPNLIKVHAMLMCIAWMALTPLAIFTARYYKEGFKHKLVFDTKIWLIIHRTASLLTVTLILGGLTAILVHLEGKITQKGTSYNHMCLGFTVITLLCILGATSIYVPGPSSRKRPIFNFFHRLLGIFLLILAAVTLYNAYEMDGFSSEMKEFCKTTVIVWGGTVLILVVCLEGYQYLMTKYMMRKIRSDQYDLDKISVRSLRINQEEKPEPSHILYAIISFFFICSLTAAVCMTVFF